MNYKELREAPVKTISRGCLQGLRAHGIWTCLPHADTVNHPSTRPSVHPSPSYPSTCLSTLPSTTCPVLCLPVCLLSPSSIHSSSPSSL